MASTLTGIATVACALFAGGALFATLVEHPARMACGPPMALAQFRRSYPRGAWLQASLAILGCASAAGAWLADGRAGWLSAGVLLGFVVPFTLVVIAPTNRRLLDPSLAPDTPETHRLLRRWGHLHLARTVLGLVALWLMLGLLASG